MIFVDLLKTKGYLQKPPRKRLSMDDIIDSFVEGGCYLLKGHNDIMFVCLPCRSRTIGKLVQFKKQTPTMWEKTGINYFLNVYFDDDIKELFLNRDNYDMIGRIGRNFEFSEDENYLLRRS